MGAPDNMDPMGLRQPLEQGCILLRKSRQSPDGQPFPVSVADGQKLGGKKLGEQNKLAPVFHPRFDIMLRLPGKILEPLRLA
ncbi:hypothetical protein D3C72_2348160 [compost metagenome]